MDSTGRKTILIVEDMELNRKILSLILQDKYNILEADNGMEAIKMLKRRGNEISLILLDIVMPVMNGFRFLSSILDGDYKDIPIIFVTSETYEENILEGVKLGIKDVIAKPFDPYIVSSRVDSIIAAAERGETQNFKQDM